MINFNKSVQTLIFSFQLFAFPTCHADPIQINVTGKIIATACTVDTVLTSGQLVDLGTAGRTRFIHAGDAGDWKSFTLSLSDCPLNTVTSTATFTGTPDNAESSFFANTSQDSTAAKNVAVQVVKDDDRSTRVSNKSSLTVSVDSNHKAIFSLAARLITPTGEVQPGTVASFMLVDFTYQ